MGPLHRVRPTCGVAPFSEGEGPGGVSMAAINLSCLRDVSLDALTIRKVDGKSF